MLKRFSLILVIFLLTITLSSCTFATTGESLESFSRRMNEINEIYQMTSEGYIIDHTECTLTKFFKMSEKDLMLKFKYDKKHRLNEMNIVFEPVIVENSPESLNFIYDCIKCFTQNESITKTIFESTDFENTIRKTNLKTISAESDNIKMEIDTTNLGTVITVYKDI